MNGGRPGGAQSRGRSRSRSRARSAGGGGGGRGGRGGPRRQSGGPPGGAMRRGRSRSRSVGRHLIFLIGWVVLESYLFQDCTERTDDAYRVDCSLNNTYLSLSFLIDQTSNRLSFNINVQYHISHL